MLNPSSSRKEGRAEAEDKGAVGAGAMAK